MDNGRGAKDSWAKDRRAKERRAKDRHIEAADRSRGEGVASEQNTGQVLGGGGVGEGIDLAGGRREEIPIVKRNETIRR